MKFLLTMGILFAAFTAKATCSPFYLQVTSDGIRNLEFSSSGTNKFWYPSPDTCQFFPYATKYDPGTDSYIWDGVKYDYAINTMEKVQPIEANVATLQGQMSSAQSAISALQAATPVLSVSAGTGISISGTATAPVVGISNGGVGSTQIDSGAVGASQLGTSAVDLAGIKVTGIASIARGGTNSSTSLNNNRIMKSSSGSIVESAAITGNKTLVSDSNGIPVASSVSDSDLAGYGSRISALESAMPAAAASTPSRTLNSSGYQISASKPAYACYTIGSSCTTSLVAGSCSASVELRSDSNSTPTTVRGKTSIGLSGTLVVTLVLTNAQEVPVCYLVPPGHYVRLVSSTSGTASVSISQQSEVVLH